MPFITQGKTNFPYLLIFIGLAIIAGGFILCYYYLWIIDIESRLVDIEIKLPPKTIEGETADWKVYRNEEYGFELAYPPFYEIGEPQKWILTGQPVATLLHQKTNLLHIAVFGDYFKNYELIDNPGDLIFHFDTESKQWLNEDNQTSEFAPQKIEAPFEVYIYSSGDITCKWDWLIIPNPSYSYVVEITNTTCGELYKTSEESLNYKKPDFILDSKQMISTFRFIKKEIDEKETSVGEFCGWSTNGSCGVNSDCITGGCSGQVCQSKNEEGVITTCEWRDCYDEAQYGLECKCVDSKCQWSK